ncbi:lytic transglycosylase domain-containing protein [Mesorhizobium sp. B2-4-6]|uniref:lytic transglycosylase domain-containing protein n=1 Tax=Mesorhizobium sp. B2-4-6 TaxID=2589943 RepID=UPI001127EC29|nr:lytic transglycosylase domain-containing protein [Mesorhizobium sp. B2-4-6]
MFAGLWPTSRHNAPGRLRAARRLALPLLCGLSIATGLPPEAVAQDPAIARSSQRDPFAAHVSEASHRFGVPAALIRVIMRQESAGDTRAVSSAGARGLMQIMPGTWEDLRARWSLGADPFDPRDNILAGTAYLRELHDRFGSPGFLAAYNAGPARYEAYLAGRPLPDETRAYVAALSPLARGLATARPFATAPVTAVPCKHAALFVRWPDRAPSVVVPMADRPPNSTVSATVVRDVSGLVPPSAGLFVKRTGERGPPMRLDRPCRTIAGSSAAWRVWRLMAVRATGRWQDKRAHFAPRSSGWFHSGFWRAPHIVAIRRNVASRPKALLAKVILHIAGPRHGR